jgi:Domain of unknown function (DUF5011)/Protein of unknown function (DUF1566)
MQMQVLGKIFSRSAAQPLSRSAAQPLSRSAALTSVVFALLLTACGSQDSANTSVASTNNAYPATNSIAPTAPSVQTDSGLLKSLAVLYPNGQLPANRAAQTAQQSQQNPAALKLTADTNNRVTAQSTASISPQAVAADYKPVNRLRMPPSTLYGAYFFTIYDVERDAALASNADWTQEGPAFWTSLAAGDGLNPVHRYRNLFNGSYIYTIYDSERADIAANYSTALTYEGVAWYARQTPSDGWSPLYRFRNLTNNTYLFTAYETEKDAIVAGYSAVFTLEGIAYYVRQNAPADPIVVPPVVPDTTAPVITLLGDNPMTLPAGTAYTEAGATCVDDKDPTCTVVTTGTVNTATAGAYTITYTATDAAGNASSKTRAVTVATCTAAANASTGYSLVFKGCSAANVAEYYDKTECVRDNATGLIWEGKPTSGLRANNNIYTNYDSTTALQKYTGLGPAGPIYIAPTQAEIDASNNSIGYKTAVNSTNLCGSAAWRLPTLIELQGIVNTTESPTITSAWFPNTIGNNYWTSSPRLGFESEVFVCYFVNGTCGYVDRYHYQSGYLNYYLRLVR